MRSLSAMLMRLVLIISTVFPFSASFPSVAEAGVFDICIAFLTKAKVTQTAPTSIQPLPPKGAWMIALGVGDSYMYQGSKSELVRFAHRRAGQLNRPVATFSEFKSTGYIGYSRMWNHSGLNVTEKVAETIEGAVTEHPQTKVILFKLDDFDPRKLFREDGSESESFTNFEVRLLTRDARYFAATRWFLKDKELSYAELTEFFGQYVQLPPESK